MLLYTGQRELYVGEKLPAQELQPHLLLAGKLRGDVLKTSTCTEFGQRQRQRADDQRRRQQSVAVVATEAASGELRAASYGTALSSTDRLTCCGVAVHRYQNVPGLNLAARRCWGALDALVHDDDLPSCLVHGDVEGQSECPCF